MKVIKAFIDKYTGKGYNSGSVYAGNDPDRIKELQKGGYLEDVPFKAEPEQEPKAEQKPKRKPSKKK